MEEMLRVRKARRRELVQEARSKDVERVMIGGRSSFWVVEQNR